MEFHEFFNSYMNEHRISNYKMSQDTGISDSLIGYWRAGRRKPNMENLILISDYLGLSLDVMLKGRDNASILSDTSILLPDEDELLNTYRKLDRRGQHRVHTVIYEELDRSQEEKSRPE